MINRFIEFSNTDPALGDVFNEKVVVPGNELIEEHNSNAEIVANLRMNDIEARREILDIKLKLDELAVVDYLNKTGIGFYDLFEDASNVDSVNTTATVADTDVTFAGVKTLQMKQETYTGFTDLELALYDAERELFEVDVDVSASTTISMDITPGSRTVGEKFLYGGEVYTIANVVES